MKVCTVPVFCEDALPNWETRTEKNWTSSNTVVVRIVIGSNLILQFQDRCFSRLNKTVFVKKGHVT